MSDGPVFDAEQEVRFALVLYGGASLAIYMYGIAEEFLHLVRATAPEPADPGWRARSPIPRPRAPRRSTASSGRWCLGPVRRRGRVRTRFVVDVISGTSAGGINGVCLAKALANGTTVAGLKKIWLNDGDIGGLINDRRSVYEDDARQTLVRGLADPFTPSRC